MAAVEAAHHTPETAVRRFNIVEILSPPPEAVVLFRKRPGGVDAGVDKQQRLVLGEGGAPEHAHQHGVAVGGAHGGAQGTRPLGQHQGAAVAGAAGFFDRASIGRQRRRDALLQHPFQDLAGIGGELDLQQLVPHLLLAAAQIDDVVIFRPGSRQKGAAEQQQLLDGLGDGVAPAQEVAQVNQVLAHLEAPRQMAVQGAQAVRLAVNGGHGPVPAPRRQCLEMILCRHPWTRDPSPPGETKAASASGLSPRRSAFAEAKLRLRAGRRALRPP